MITDIVIALSIVLYVLGALIAIGYQYKYSKYIDRSGGELDHITRAVMIGSLSWIIIGIAYYYMSTNRKPTRKSKKKTNERRTNKIDEERSEE